jgi:hypothetical protein
MSQKHKQNYAGFHLRSFISAAVILLFCLFMSPLKTVAQENGDSKQLTVKGKVVEANKTPIIGASILVDGTKNGTITDINGEFSIKAPTNGTLAISYKFI